MKHVLLISLIFLTSCLNRSEPPKPESLDKSPDLNVNYIAASDSVFSIFIEEFGYNPDLQMSRVSFPLDYDSLSIKTSIKKDKWKNDRLFVDLESVTYINNDLKSDENSMERVFSWINTETLISKNYYFKKDNNKWHLVQIRIVEESVDQSKENFYSFLSSFCQDSTFQKQRVSFPIKITTINEEFEPVDYTCSEDEWRFLGFYFNIDELAMTYYDFLRTFIDTDIRILQTKGNGNGISAMLRFQRIGGKWFLTRLDDQST